MLLDFLAGDSGAVISGVGFLRPSAHPSLDGRVGSANIDSILFLDLISATSEYPAHMVYTPIDGS